MKKFYLTIFSLALLFLSAKAQTLIPVGDELILPQYAYYGGTSRVSSLFYVCRLKLSGLTASTQYRYASGMSSTSTITTTFAPGHMMNVVNTTNATYGNIIGYSTLKGLNGALLQNDAFINSGATNYFGQFTTDAAGSYTGWFISVPTNGTGQASGNDVYFYVNLALASPAVYLPTFSYRTTSTVKLLDYSATTAGITALVGTTVNAPNVGNEKFVSLYGNTAGTGRPLATTFTENDGISETTIFTGWYASNVGATSGNWGAVIPNDLATGVRAIKFYNPSDGSDIVIGDGSGNISTDGTWNGVSTVNLSGGTTAVTINSIAPTTLPIKLTSFTGKSDFNGVNLSWTTASETNNDKFTVYRSTNGKDFTEIGTIKGQGNSSSVNTYSFKDAKAVNGTNYYKLKQTDFNGASEEFSPIFVDYSLAKSSNNLKVYASQNKANLELNWQADEMVNINIIDISGRKIYSNKIQVQKGSNLINLDLAGITIGSGINILRVSGANSVEVAKFLNNQ